MEFTSFSGVLSIAVFFAVYALVPLRWRTPLIAWGSLAFYALCYPPGVLLILFFAGLAWAFARLTRGGTRPQPLLLAAGVLAALGVLFAFKYYNFFLNSLSLPLPRSQLILPVGISFYTFTVIGYLVDIHARRVEPAQDFTNNLLVVAFWPHLAAGPILRAKTMLDAIRQPRPLNPASWRLAGLLIVGGAAKKLLIADNLGAYVNDNLVQGVAGMTGPDALATLLGFTGQIYADFSGYSDMAIGFALLLGFRLPANFFYPYRATTLTAFWRRWHISLSNWFRDYVFIALGGSRLSQARTVANLLLVFLLSGLWHGAGENFIVWGALHGGGVALERVVRRPYARVPAGLRWMVTFAVTVSAWAFFRVDVGEAVRWLARIADVPSYLTWTPDSRFAVLPLLAFVACVLLDHLVRPVDVDADGFPALPARGGRWRLGYVTILYAAALLLSGRPLPFIYFNF